MKKHTPGPWNVSFTKFSEVRAENGAVIAVCKKLTGLVNLEANARLISAAPDLLEALIAANEFIDGIRQDLHHERVADWYPEGAHNSAAAMSESMRLIGNKCADFDVASAAIQKATGETR